MNKISLHFDDEYIYDSKDMSVLGFLPNKAEKCIEYQLYRIKENYKVELAIIDFNQKLRNVLYTLFPDVIIIIDPLKVKAMIKTNLSYDLDSSEIGQEVAASLDKKVEFQESGFIDSLNIYNNPTKNAAMENYKNWQGEVPLGIEAFNDIINTIDFYYEEVFNYFEYKNLPQIRAYAFLSHIT